MEKHKPDVDAIRRAEEEIARLTEFVEEEKSKVPTEEEWHSWSGEKRRKWTERANDKQLAKLQFRR